MHSNVLSDTIRPSRPHVFWGDLVSLFWILLLTASWNLQFLVTVLGCAFELCCFLFREIHLALKIFVICNSTTDSLVLFPFSSSRVLWLSIYILSILSIIVGSSIGRMKHLCLHIYNRTTNPTKRCFFPYLVNFMATVVGLVHTISPFLLPIHYCFLVIYLVTFL
jgi:hypothetical protein